MRSLPTKLLLVALSAALTLAAANVALWALNFGDIEVYDHDPEYGYLTKPDQWPSPRGIVFRINQAGLRGPDFSPTKRAGHFTNYVHRRFCDLRRRNCL